MEPKIETVVWGNEKRISPKSAIVVLLHGYGANEQDLPSLMNYLPGEFPWVSLRAPLDAGNGGFAWSPIITPGNPRAEDIEPATERIWNWIDAKLPKTAPLILIGFSQGGLMATQLLRTRPSRILGTVVLAGFTLGAEQPADKELVAKKPKVIYCRGLQDQVISPATALRTLGWLKAHTDVQVETYDGLGHSIDERVMADVSKYVEELF